MSHYSVTVILPASYAGDIADLDLDTSILNRALSHYNENNFHEKVPGSISAKWDWWVVGGRWRGSFPRAAGAFDVIATRERHPEFDRKYQPGHCDGGRKRDLALDYLRKSKGEQAGKDWDEYTEIVAGVPAALPWSHFLDRHLASERELLGDTWSGAIDTMQCALRAELKLPVDDEHFWDTFDDFCETDAYKEYDRRSTEEINELKRRMSMGYTIEMARQQYGAQELVKLIRGHEKYKHWFMDSPIEEIGAFSREDYIQRQTDAAIPGFATLLVTTDEKPGTDIARVGNLPVSRDGMGGIEKYDTQWIAKGEMGWFGMSTDSEDSNAYYLSKVNKLIDELPDDAIILTVDCHI